MKPLIGISCSVKCNEKTGNFTFLPQEQHVLNDAYTAAVERAGGIPVILPSFENPELMEEVVGRLDGVIISGGPDVDPAFFGERIMTGVGPIDIRRDAAEMVLAKYVLQKTEMPILGICRGLQVINIAEGGDLYQDLQAQKKADHRLSMYPRFVPSHDVKLEAGCRLAGIMGGTEVRTNSFHHQALRRVADGWNLVGTAVDDGIIEAIEKPGDRFAVAVQWHPEALFNNDEEQAIFRALVAAAKEYRK